MVRQNEDGQSHTVGANLADEHGTPCSLAAVHGTAARQAVPIGELVHLANKATRDREVHRRRMPKAVDQGSKSQDYDDKDKRKADPTDQPELSPNRRAYTGRVIAPSLAEETSAAYLAKTPC
jgi:hypothetical protein